jgi:hypothetical protein
MLFVDYQKVLKKKGMAISADCSHECYGNILLSKKGKNSKLNIVEWMKGVVLEELSGLLVEENQELKESREPGMSEANYNRHLVSEFDDEKEYESGMEWIDPDNPAGGIIAKSTGDFYSYFDVRVNPKLISSVWTEELCVDVDASTNQKILDEIEFFLEEREIDVAAATDSKKIDWSEMHNIGGIISMGDISAKNMKIALSYKKKLLAPILDQYKKPFLYVAASDTVYFCIGRPHFYPILFGERVDGTYEITIFESVQE